MNLQKAYINWNTKRLLLKMIKLKAQRGFL